MFVVCLLALSVSLDTLGIGMAYAMSGICIPKRIRLFIALLNGVLTAVALFRHALRGCRNLVFALLAVGF